MNSRDDEFRNDKAREGRGNGQHEASADELADHRIGAVFGSYRLLNRIGQGGFAVVYRAENISAATPHLRHVAVKVLKTLATPQMESRLRSEVDAMRLVSHPGLVTVIENGVSKDGVAWLAMGLIDGQPIHQYCDEAGADWREIVDLGIQVCDAIEHAHQRGVLHRDLKPSNILVRADGTPVVTDFGLVRFLGDAAATVSLQLAGTPSYMAPEYLMRSVREDGNGNGSQPGPEIDVYGIGATLYRLISGVAPRDTSNDLVVLMRLLISRPDPRLENPKVPCPRSLAAVIEKSLASKPQSRYASVADLRADLVRVREGHPPTARRAGRAERLWSWCCRQPGTAAVSVLVLVLTVGLGILLLDAHAAWSRRNQLRQTVSRELEEEVRQIIDLKETPPHKASEFMARFRRQQAMLQLAREPSEILYRSAVGQFMVAEHLNEVGRYDRARDALLRAEDQFERLHDSGYRPEATKFDLFQCAIKGHWIEACAGQPELARGRASKALRLIRELVRERPEVGTYHEARASACQAWVFANRDDSRVPAILREGLQAAQRACELDGRSQHGRAVVVLEHELAIAAAQQSDAETADRWFRMAATTLSELLAASEDKFYLSMEQYRLLASRFNFRVSTGRLDEAAADLQQMERVMADLRDQYPGHADVRVAPDTLKQCHALLDQATQ